MARLLGEMGEPPVVVLISSRDSTAYRRRLAASTARGFIAKAELSGFALVDLIG